MSVLGAHILDWVARSKVSCVQPKAYAQEKYVAQICASKVSSASPVGARCLKED